MTRRALTSSFAPSARAVLAGALVLTSVAFSASWAALAPSQASAQQSDDDLARHFFETGRTYFDRAEYTEAAEAFGEAYRLSGRAALLVNQARALEADGEVAAAIAALERAEQELDESSSLYPSIAPRLQRLRAQQEQEEQDAAIAADQAAAAERAAAEAAASADAEGGTAGEASSDDEAGGPGTLFWVGVGTAGLGAAALITSLATGIASNGIYSDLEAACPGDICPPEYAGDIDRGNALAGASTAMLFIGVIAAAAGVTLMLLDGGSDEEDAEAASAALRVGPASVMVDGRF